MRIAFKRFGLLVSFCLVIITHSTVTEAQEISREIAREQLKSGFETMAPDIQAMQRNDSENPAMLWIKEGETHWQTKPDGASQSCAGCHGEAPISMKSVAARYPAFDQGTQPVLDLSSKIQQCRQDRQGGSPLPYESRALLSLTAYIGLQSRGDIMRSPDDPRLSTQLQAGKQLFNQRIGQLNLSCAACHDDQWGKRLGGSLIPQGHGNGYPLYRLEWQNLGSLQRRLRNCMTGVRAEPFAYGDPNFINLELYLKARAADLRIETPAVRP
jgi:L-cysteine S-thiosulfotransferase